MCVPVVKGGPVAGCEDGMVGGRLDGVGDRVGRRELPVECGVDIVGLACAAVADNCGVTGDDVSGRLVGSTEVSWMKVPVVDTGIGVVVTGASGMEGGTTSRLDGSIVMRDAAIGSQQQQQQQQKYV